MGDEAHSGSYHGSYGLTHARFTHRHRRHALPLHTCSSTTPPKHSPAQNGQGPPLGDPGSLWLATALGSSAAVSGSRHDSTPTASFEVRLVDLLWPQPPLTCSSHHDSTPGPLIPVVAACVKDARPSRWLAPLERPRWPQHRPRVAPPAKPSLSAVESVELAGGEPPRGQQRSAVEASAPQAKEYTLCGGLSRRELESRPLTRWRSPMRTRTRYAPHATHRHDGPDG